MLIIMLLLVIPFTIVLPQDKMELEFGDAESEMTIPHLQVDVPLRWRPP